MMIFYDFESSKSHLVKVELGFSSSQWTWYGTINPQGVNCHDQSWRPRPVPINPAEAV